ncbi:hypothetical protein DEU56DRAFT_982667 [Suillus clintonianus]|uniref:uncharacterized protein n=1 Tax=Suillus clintonianus TaxID=1904413 RepID=UPI001B883590|nr:uncharacterized protein DEU56DRAFT_982667 [Suillus clintonianus]KAG2127675.1 hypothetical protein DEU56DRAFT_982667 [Suillus clintonianus]
MTYPKDGLYYLQNSSKPDCYATIRSGEDVLRGDTINGPPIEKSRKWRLTEVNQSDASGLSQFYCTLTQEKDNDTLGVKAIKDFQPIYSIDGSQSWFLDQASEGYTIGVTGHDGRYTWHLRDTGEPVCAPLLFRKVFLLNLAQIVISIQGIMPSQSWKFLPAE